MISLAVALLALLMTAIAARAADTVTIGFVDLADDPRHESRMGAGSIPLEIRGRARDGALLALQDLSAVSAAVGVRFELATAEAPNAEAFVASVDQLVRERGARAVIIDATADIVSAVARATRGRNVILFNVSAEEDGLRGRDCALHLFHLYPALAMRSDALAQYIVAHKWRDVLVLEGPSPQDAAFVAAFERSAKRFGARIVGKRSFVLGHDPRVREQNNMALLTGGLSYDTVFVADDSREFARFLPYRTLAPRPVIGSAGLTAEAWHWTWDRAGGANLSRRFRRMAHRPMRGEDWAAWIGVKVIAEAVLRTKSTEAEVLAAELRRDDFRVDGSKGQALSFRAWDNQLRQPIQLATPEAVIAQAPLAPFLHQSDNLDTLGVDRPESTCSLSNER